MHATPSSFSLPFALRDEPEFHRFTYRAVAAALAAGLLHAAADGFHKGLPAWLFAGPALLLFAPRLDVGGRLMMGGALCGSAVFAFLFPVLPVIVAFGAVLGGLLFMARRTNAKGSAQVQWPHLFAAVTAGVGMTMGSEWVLARLWATASGSPLGASFAVDAALVAASGLLLALVELPLHLQQPGDLVREEGEHIMATLHGRFAALGKKALWQYDECRKLLGALPSDEALRELETTFTELSRSAFKHLREWSGVDEELASANTAATAMELQRLRTELCAATDLIAKGHLASAVAALEEELQRMEAITHARARALARLEAQVALLSRVRGALLGIRSGHAEVRSAELAALARKLLAQSRTQSLEGAVMQEVATGAELDQLTR